MKESAINGENIFLVSSISSKILLSNDFSKSKQIAYTLLTMLGLSCYSEDYNECLNQCKGAKKDYNDAITMSGISMPMQ